eukprot:TRINITY_DN92270_c0_g1_i1.p1 TRINITY_DN92270_c0_g1~~TRINITY_DN92270_c0_g1_i1.p1  ORF type:complete len:539 (+),score=100.05 TRINITY_DN92270_c0_g1_i1:46-1662(+)
MGSLYPWLVLAAAMLGLILLTYIVYHYFVDPEESYFLAMITVILSLTVGILCTLVIPVDIYVISEGSITSESLHVTISQDHVRSAYLALFSSLLFIAFCLVPFAYFYGEDRGLARDFQSLDKPHCWNAMRSTTFFVGFVLVLLVLGLNFRPGHTQTLDHAMESEEKAVRWLNDLLDVQHGGLNAISFAIACLTLAGVFGWVMYSAYGLAAMPFSWLRGKQTPSEQRQDVETSIASIREKYRSIQSRYSARDDGSLDLSRMKASDRKELNLLQREHKNLMQHNYRLQEVELKAGSCIPKLLSCLVPFRLLIGATMLSLSLLIVLSLLLTLLDRLLHSACGWNCGYTLQERRIYNPADEVYLRLSRVFPIDFVFLSIVVLYIFASTLFGIFSLDIRLLCFSVYTLRARKTQPQGLLVMCNAVAYILLALCVALLTIAPDYTTFGSQRRSAGNSGELSNCSLARDDSYTSGCQVSVIATFFTRIAISMPVFSIAYFFANWAFIAVFALVFVQGLLFQQRQPYLDTAQECEEEEELGLLAFS